MANPSEQIVPATPATQAPALVRASDRLSTFLGIPKDEMIRTIKAQCFRGTNPDNVSDAQLAAFVSVANDMGVNPLLPGMLYAYPDRGAIFPIMGPDGIYKKLSEHPSIESWETTVFPEDPTVAPTHATAKIYRKGVERPISYTATLTEWRVNSNPNWNTRPRHMLGLRALKQCARQVIHGLPGDEDDRMIAEINVTPQAQPERPPPPPKAKRGAAAVKENPGSIEVSATPVAEGGQKAGGTETAAPTQGVADAPTNPAPVPPAQPEKAKEPIHELKDGETVTLTCKIEEFVGKELTVAGKPSPSVKARLTGEFEGEVYHLGGAKKENDKVVCPPEYQLEQPVEFTLIGVMNKGSGRVIPQVKSVKIPGAPAEAADEF